MLLYEMAMFFHLFKNVITFLVSSSTSIISEVLIMISMKAPFVDSRDERISFVKTPSFDSKDMIRQ